MLLASTPLERRVEPEWLDGLDSTDPRAVRSRRDLRLLNRIMTHARIIRRALRDWIPERNIRVAEIGAGDGTVLLRTCARTAPSCGGNIVLVDRQPVVDAETVRQYEARDYRVSVVASDVFDWLSQQTEEFDIIVANLFLHHFDEASLRRLFEIVAVRTKLFVVCEPRRASFPLAASRMLGLIGCNDVTRHDAVLSVRAGFSGQELSQLWPATEGWTLDERPAGLFSHLFTAEKPL